MVILSFFILNTTNGKLSNPRRRRRRPFVAFGEARAYPIKIAAFRRVFRVRRAPDLAIACLSEFIRVLNEMTHEVLRLTHQAQVGLDFASAPCAAARSRSARSERADVRWQQTACAGGGCSGCVLRPPIAAAARQADKMGPLLYPGSLKPLSRYSEMSSQVLLLSCRARR